MCDHNGQPIVVDGFYVSTTSLQDPRYSTADRRRYVDAQSIPFIVLPAAHFRAWGVRMGDLAWVQKLDGNDVVCGCGAIFADAGPSVGEGSAELVRKLDLDPDPKHGGTNQARVQMFVFTASGNGLPATAEGIQEEIVPLLAALRQVTGIATGIATA